MTAWQSIADRGEFVMSVASRECAEREGIDVAPGVTLVAVIVPDGFAPAFCLCFTSGESLREFVREMEPREVTIRDEAEAEGLRAILACDRWLH